MVNHDRYNKEEKRALLERLQSKMKRDSDGEEEFKKRNGEKPNEEQGVSGAVENEQEQDGGEDSDPKVKESVVDSPGKALFISNPKRLIIGSVVVIVLIGLFFLFSQIIDVGAGEDATSNYIGPLPAADSLDERASIDASPHSLCSKVPGYLDPEISADHYVSVYTDSFQIAYGKGYDEKVSFASIVKLLGAIVALEKLNLEDQISLKEEVNDEGNGIDLEVGEVVRVQDLLGAALVGSKNDAMMALAQNYPGGTEAFIARMQILAAEIGLEGTSVVNVVGTDHPNQYATPRDLAVLSIVAMRDPVISNLVGQASYVVNTSFGREEVVWSTNTLLTEVPGVVGVKTGFTSGAGMSLVTYVDDDPDFVTVVLNAEDRYEESKVLIQAVRDGYVCQ